MSEAAQTVKRAMDWEQVDLYRFFANALAEPGAQRFAWFCQPGFAEGLAELWTDLGCEGDFPGFEFFDEGGEYESTYIALFDVGVPEPPVPLLESAHCRSVPAQQTALENASFYEVLGLKVDPARTAPDHLLTQLEFLSVARYLRENAENEGSRTNLAQLEKDFLQRHLLNWVPAAREKLARCSVPAFSTLLSLLLAFLRAEEQRLADSLPH